MSSRTRATLVLALALVAALVFRVAAQSGAKALPILPPTLVDPHGTSPQPELVGTWQGDNVYPHRNGYFARSDLTLRFTSHGTVEVTQGPYNDGGVITGGTGTLRGEYRVLGSGVVLSLQGLSPAPAIVLTEIVVTADTLSFTSIGQNQVLHGGGTLRRQ